MAKNLSTEYVKIQDIPKEVLQIYGIALVDEPAFSDNRKSPPLLMNETNDSEDEENESVLVICEPAKDICGFCHNEVTEDSILNHNKNHCHFSKCHDFIHSDRERQEHIKMHSHESKPMQCFICRKRYKHFSLLERHRKYCKLKNPVKYLKGLERRKSVN